MLQEIPAGIHFLLFITTLQRGGTCAAHGIEKNRENSIFWRGSFEGGFWEGSGRVLGRFWEDFERVLDRFWMDFGKIL